MTQTLAEKMAAQKAAQERANRPQQPQAPRQDTGPRYSREQVFDPSGKSWQERCTQAEKDRDAAVASQKAANNDYNAVLRIVKRIGFWKYFMILMAFFNSSNWDALNAAQKDMEFK